MRSRTSGGLAAVVLLGVGSLLGQSLGCGSATTPSEAGVVLDFTTSLEDAERRSRAGRVARKPYVEAGDPGEFVQAFDSSVSWYFAIPADATLRASATLRGSGPPPKVVVRAMDGAGTRRTLVQHALVPGEPLTIDANLDEFAGRLTRIRIDVRGAGGRVVWRDLRIEAAAPDPLPPGPDLERGAYNVLLVLFDTLRADRLSPYAETRAETPNIARLAAGGALFEDVYSNATYTTPSVATILTSVHPTLHRAGGLPRFGGNPMLPDGLPSLPEILQENGYATRFVFNNQMVSGEFGFGRGFDDVVSHQDRRVGMILPDDATPESEAAATWDEYVAPFLAQTGDRPFFLYLHEIDPHDPYAPPKPWDELYTDVDYKGRMDGFRTALHRLQLQSHPERATAADVNHMNALYDGEVAFADAYLGHLLDKLDAAGLTESTLVVFVSDHGELIGDGGLFGHGHHPREAVLRVPLVLSLPGVVPAGARIGAPVELLDLSPTILDLLGVEVPAGMRGRSLLPLLAAPDASRPEQPIIATGHFAGRFSRHVVRFRNWKLVRHNAGSEEGLAEPLDQLFDLSRDPGETRDVSRTAPVVAGALRQMLRARIREDAALSPWRDEEILAEPLMSDAEARLRALGYIE